MARKNWQFAESERLRRPSETHGLRASPVHASSRADMRCGPATDATAQSTAGRFRIDATNFTIEVVVVREEFL